MSDRRAAPQGQRHSDDHPVHLPADPVDDRQRRDLCLRVRQASWRNFPGAHSILTRRNWRGAELSELT